MRPYFHLAAAMSVASAAPASAAPPPTLDAFAKKAMAEFDAPGMAIAIVEGEESLAKGYGVRRLGSAAKIDEHSVFSIGSMTKAFTSAAAAILVTEGRLGWDDRVIDRLPGFRMHDPWVTRELRLRDILSHRSGLGESGGELLYFPSTDISRSEILHRARFIKPATSLRTSFAYNNLAFVVAGEVIASASGQSWESFVQERLMAPLGMTDSVSSLQALKAKGLTNVNLAWPHLLAGGATRFQGQAEPAAEPADDDNVAAAGAVYASAADVVRWMQLQLDRGLVRATGKRLYGEREAAEMWSRHITISPEAATGPLALTVPTDASYALGWYRQDYRGHEIIMHSGGSVGARTVAALLPDKKVGIWVMINFDDGAARWATFYHMLDHYLGLPPVDWIAKYREAGDIAIAKTVQSRKAAARASGQQSASLDGLAGTYCEPAYGTITVKRSGDRLGLTFDRTPGMTSQLSHVRFNTFRTDFSQKFFEDILVNFGRDGFGSVREISLDSVFGGQSNYSDLKFRPLAAGALCGE